MTDVGERIRERLKAEMKRQKLSQEDVKGLLKWSQSRVSQKLTGRTPITIDELADLAFAVSLTLVELVRDPGLEFVADLSPTEMRFLERLRQLTAQERDALSTMLYLRERTELHERRALEKKERKVGMRLR